MGPPPSFAAPSQAEVVVGPGFEETGLEGKCQVLEDPEGGLGLSEVMTPEFADRFEPHAGGGFNFGLSHSAYWFRFRLDFRPGAPRELYLYLNKPFLAEVDLYLPLKEGGGYSRRSGGTNPLTPLEDAGYHFPVFLVDTSQVAPGWAYLRVRARQSSFHLGLADRDLFERQSRSDILVNGLLLGILTALMFYNLGVFLMLRDRDILYYSLYIFSMILYLGSMTGVLRLMGLSQEFLAGTVLYQYAAAYILALAFSRSFLHTRTNTPLPDLLLRLLMLVIACIALMTALGWVLTANRFAYAISLSGPVILGWAGVRRIIQGYHPARFYLAAWICLGAGLVLFTLRGAGLAPHNFLTQNALNLGAALEAMLLSLALGDRIRSMRREKAALQQRERRLAEMVITDGLTGLANKAFFQSKLESEIAHCHRLKLPLCLLMADVDHFKRFNDTYGHPEGDVVLAELGRVMRQAVRGNDIPCRYGGEEFAVILPGADMDTACYVAERIRFLFASRPFRPLGGQVVRVTLSFGAACLDAGETPEDLVTRADQALYRAKEAGRDRVVAG